MSATYSEIKALSEPEVMTDFLARGVGSAASPAVGGKGVRAVSGRRFEAPRVLWNVYEAELELPGGVEIKPLIWTKAFFNDADCEDYRHRISWVLRHRNGNPLDPQGYVRFFPERNYFVFFFPTDPTFPSMPTVFDVEAMRPILEPHYQYLRHDATIRSVKAVRVKYMTEISCIDHYEADIREARQHST